MRPGPACLSAVLALSSTAQAASPFRHVVIVVQENRTPDNLFGSNPTFEPGVDIARSGVDSTGQTIPLGPVALANCYDISHTHSAFVASLTQGADQDPVLVPKGCTAPANPQYKYADNSTGIVQPYFDIAAQYGFANRMFQTNQGPSFPAHQFLFGATSAPTADSPLFAAENMNINNPPLGAGCAAPSPQTVNLIDPHGSETTNTPIPPCFNHPTLATLLDGAPAPISWTYYSSSPLSIWTAPNAIRDLCRAKTSGGTTQCTGHDWVHNVVPANPAQVLADIGGCKLPAVSWVIPTGANSDHAGFNKGTGPQWVASIVNAVGTQTACGTETYWTDTVVLVTWDDWGGWYDHVAPFKVTARPPLAWGDGYTYGFRVPLLVVSAYTPAGYVSNDVLDFGSLVAFVEHVFGLGHVGAGTNLLNRYADAQADARGTMDDFFPLTQPRAFAPVITGMSAADFLHAKDESALYPDED